MTEQSTIIRRNIIMYMAMHGLALAFALYAFRLGDMISARKAVHVIGFAGPWSLLCTIKEMRRVRRGEPANPARDLSFPAFALAVPFWLAYLLL